MLLEGRGLALGLGIGGGVVVLAIAQARILVRSDHDLRDAVLRLGHVELRAVLVVKILHVLIRHGDLGHHFVIDHFLNGKLLADVVFQIVHRVIARS